MKRNDLFSTQTGACQQFWYSFFFQQTFDFTVLCKVLAAGKMFRRSFAQPAFERMLALRATLVGSARRQQIHPLPALLHCFVEHIERHSEHKQWANRGQCFPLERLDRRLFDSMGRVRVVALISCFRQTNDPLHLSSRAHLDLSVAQTLLARVVEKSEHESFRWYSRSASDSRARRLDENERTSTLKDEYLLMK